MSRLDWVPNWIIFSALVIVLIQMADRRPPFVFLDSPPVAARAGEVVLLRATVERDTSRDCNASVSRSFFDISGARLKDYEMVLFSADAIRMTDVRTPGRLEIGVLIPSTAPPGASEIVSTAEYRCNIGHLFWPVVLTHRWQVTVLP